MDQPSPIDRQWEVFYILDSGIRNALSGESSMKLQPQDVVVLLKLAKSRSSRPTYAQMAHELSLSASQVHASVKRAQAVRLVHGRELGERVNIAALEEFLVHGLKYVFPAEKGGMERGMSTGYAAAPLSNFIASSDDPIPVWPCADGADRGYAFMPLHKNVPKAAQKDPQLRELLALVDALRDGRARERGLAERELAKRLRNAI
jgi:hypothetical protein